MQAFAPCPNIIYIIMYINILIICVRHMLGAFEHHILFLIRTHTSFSRTTMTSCIQVDDSCHILYRAGLIGIIYYIYSFEVYKLSFFLSLSLYNIYIYYNSNIDIICSVFNIYYKRHTDGGVILWGTVKGTLFNPLPYLQPPPLDIQDLVYYVHSVIQYNNS